MGKQEKETRLDGFVLSLFGDGTDEDGALGKTPEERAIRTGLRATISLVDKTWNGRGSDAKAVRQAVYLAIMANYDVDYVGGAAMLQDYESSRTDPVAHVLQQLANITGQPNKQIDRTPVGGYAPEPDRASFRRHCTCIKLMQGQELTEDEHKLIDGHGALPPLPEGFSLSIDDLNLAFDAAVEALQAHQEALVLQIAERAKRRNDAREARKNADQPKQKKDQGKKHKAKKADAPVPAPAPEPTPKQGKGKKGKKHKGKAKKRGEVRVPGLAILGDAFAAARGNDTDEVI